MDGILRTFTATVRHEGGSRAMARAVNRILRLHRFRLFGRDVDGAVPAPPLPHDAQFRELRLDELRSLRDGRTDLPADFFRDEIDPDERPFAILVGGELAFIEWVSDKGSSGFFQLGGNEVEGAAVYCLRPFRGRSLHRVMQGQLLPLLRREGKSRIYYAVHADNVSGIKPLEHTGFEDVGTGYRLAVFTWVSRARHRSPRDTVR